MANRITRRCRSAEWVRCRSRKHPQREPSAPETATPEFFALSSCGECLHPFEDQLHGGMERIKHVPRRSFTEERPVAWRATTIFGWTCP